MHRDLTDCRRLATPRDAPARLYVCSLQSRGLIEIAEQETAAQQPLPGGDASFQEQVRALIAGALSPDNGLTPLKGFKLDFAANPGFDKFYFSARCDCGTAALLSIEVSRQKTLEEVKRTLPALVSRLEGQARAFYSMPCEMHRRMRLGPAAGR